MSLMLHGDNFWIHVAPKMLQALG